MRAALGYWVASVHMAQILTEAQSVMTLRLMGMAGLWPVTASESLRMWIEKPGAFVASGGAASQAMMRGGRPDQVMAAAILPLRRKTRANSRRLARGRGA